MMSRTPERPAATTWVIVACLNQPSATRRCLSALLRHTDGSWDLIVVTRGDDAVTTAYLEGLRDAARVRMTILVAPRCASLRAAWSRGLRSAQGDRVALLRNTVVVTDAWLRQLGALADVSPRVGMVGPMTNVAPGEQGAGPAPYDLGDLPALDAFAARWRADRRGHWRTVDALTTSCVLIKRSVLDGAGEGRSLSAGSLRPRRLAIRARRLGLEPAIALDLYVHDDVRRRTKGEPARPAPTMSFLEPVTAAARGRIRRVSLTMIVRDEEQNLPACLESVTGLFDELVLVDTGSTDRTVEIARSFGAKVFNFPWVGDFAAARNAALSHASGDYAFWLDADDRVEPEERDRLRLLFGCRMPRGIMPSGSTPTTGSSRRNATDFGCCSTVSVRPRPRTWSVAPATPIPLEAGQRSSTMFGCFRFAMTCAGPTASMSRSCPRSARRASPFAGRT